MRPTVLQDLIGDEPKRLLEKGNVVAILPLGSTEFHGPRGPFGVDSDVAWEVGKRLATRLDALLLPLLPVGHSPDHKAWAGTLHLESGTLRNLILDIAASVYRHGVRTLVLLLGHWGNYDAALEAAKVCHERFPELRMEAIRVFDESVLDMSALASVFEGKQWHGHGGAAEVSVSLYARPEVKPPSPEEVRRTSPPPEERSYSRSGWHGLSEEATAERGAKAADIAAGAIAAYLRERLKL